MLARFVQIAVGRATDAQREPILEVLARANDLAAIEADFERRINASKAARGERPTRLSSARRADLKQFDADASEMDEELAAQFESMTATEVIGSLRAGLRNDLAFWQKAHKHTHPGDVEVVATLVRAKADLYDAMTRFLASMSAGGGGA